MPTGRQRIEFGGIYLAEGTYAVVESATYDTDFDAKASDLFTPITVEVDGWDKDGTVIRRFFLADVNSIAGPCIVIPDIGGPRDQYFQVKNRSLWATEFQNWLRIKHEEDEMEHTEE